MRASARARKRTENQLSIDAGDNVVSAVSRRWRFSKKGKFPFANLRTARCAATIPMMMTGGGWYARARWPGGWDEVVLVGAGGAVGWGWVGVVTVRCVRVWQRVLVCCVYGNVSLGCTCVCLCVCLCVYCVVGCCGCERDVRTCVHIDVDLGGMGAE